MAIKARGGVALVQDPEEALFKGMPQSAIDHVKVDGVLGVAALANRLVELVLQNAASGIGPTPRVPSDHQTDLELASLRIDPKTIDPREHPGTPSEYACPDCGGALWKMEDGDVLRFRCRVGHAMTADSLRAAQSDALEDALWTALRVLEEKIALTHTMASRDQGTVRTRLLEEHQPLGVLPGRENMAWRSARAGLSINRVEG